MSLLFAAIPGLVALLLFYLAYRDLKSEREPPRGWQWRFTSPALGATVSPLSLAAQRAAAGEPTVLLLTPILLFVPYLIGVVGAFREDEFDRLKDRLRVGNRFLWKLRVQDLVFLVGSFLIVYSTGTILYDVDVIA